MSNIKEKILDLLEVLFPFVCGIIGLILGSWVTEQYILILGYTLIGGVLGAGLHEGIRGFIEAKKLQRQNEPSTTQEHNLKLRFYADGRFTLNSKEVELSELQLVGKTTASNGGAICVWSEEGELSAAGSDVLKELVGGVNLRIAFATDENFSNMPQPEQGDGLKPSNAMLFNSDDEFRQYVGNETEFYVYLSNLQLHFDVYASRADADKEDVGVFHIVGAVRPVASTFWFLHPRSHDDEYYQPLIEALKGQPLPTVKEGVLAFVISNKIPLEPGEFPQFEIVAPDEWTDVPKRLGKDMSVPEILDVIWPAQRQ